MNNLPDSVRKIADQIEVETKTSPDKAPLALVNCLAGAVGICRGLGYHITAAQLEDVLEEAIEYMEYMKIDWRK